MCACRAWLMWCISEAPMHTPANAFKHALKHKQAQIGLWLSLANAYTASSTNDLHSNMGGFCHVAAYWFFKAN